jgi:hypothetical protein
MLPLSLFTFRLSACGRDFAVRKALGNPYYSVGDDGFPPGVQIRVLTDRHHASIEKAAAVVGIGRKNIVELPLPVPGPVSSIQATESNEMDVDSNVTDGDDAIIEFADLLERELTKYREFARSGSKTKYAVIVVVGFGEVNTVS